MRDTPTTVVKVNWRDRDRFLADSNFLYVGRHFGGFKGSPFGNPFKVGMRRKAAIALLRRDLDTLIRAETLDAATAVKFYRAWLMDNHLLRAMVPDLEGKRLGCWCCDWSPDRPIVKPCHAIVIAKLADSLPMTSETAQHA